MTTKKPRVTVYYDGACPKCIRDRFNYERLAGRNAADVTWFDITGKESELCELGIDPHKALKELHVKDENEVIRSELDAYILLLRKVPLLTPIAWLIGLPAVRPFLSQVYRGNVDLRLRRSNRL